MEADVFESVLADHAAIHRKKLDLIPYGITVLLSAVYIDSQDSVLVIMQDITSEEKELEHQYQLKMKTVEAAQMVIDKQMMVAQVFDGILGEITSESKATLNLLKRSILEDESK